MSFASGDLIHYSKDDPSASFRRKPESSARSAIKQTGYRLSPV
jgi:hypothetical protein